LAETAPAIAAAVSVTPRLVKNSQFFHRAVHAFLGGVFARAQRRADFAKAAPLIKSQHDGSTVGLAQFFHGQIQPRCDLWPGFSCRLV
jgi:hypothetical protein